MTLEIFLKYSKNLKIKNKIKSAKKLLEKKFSGKIIPQENFILKESAYKNKNEKLKNFLGVIFLHCFVDAPTGRGNCLFNDFYEWTDETLSFLKKIIYQNILQSSHIQIAEILVLQLNSNLRKNIKILFG